MSVLNDTELYTFKMAKMVHFMLCEFYHNRNNRLLAFNRTEKTLKSARETLMETKVNRAGRELFDLGVLLGSSVPLNIGMNES